MKMPGAGLGLTTGAADFLTALALIITITSLILDDTDCATPYGKSIRFNSLEKE